MYSLFENSIKACDEEFVRFADELGVEKKISEIFGALDKYISGDSKDIIEVLGPFKENVEKTVSLTKTSTRQKKSVLKEVSENCPENAQPVENVLVKIEKVSLLPPPAVLDKNNKNVEAKQEPAEMQAPTKLPPRKRKIKAEPAELPKRSTRTRKKNFKYDDSISEGCIRKDSDVIIQNTTITTIDLSDENELQAKKQEPLRMTRSKMRSKAQPSLSTTTIISASEKVENEIKETRSTRTKTLKNKRHRSVSEEPVLDNQTKKKSKSNSASDIEANKSAQTEYEDAVSTLETNEVLNRADAVYNKIEVNADATYVLPSTKTKIKETVKEQKVITSPLEKTPVTKLKTSKQIFSPYEKGSMKEKIEAFEKLGESASRIPKPTRSSNTKTPTKYGDADYNSQVHKTFTPYTSKFLPLTCSTSNITRLNSGRHDDSSNGNKSGFSVLKASRAEFREREKRMREKEKETLKKKEALLHEKRKKREEKQLKAQQHREQLEKEKQKQLEIQKKKDEKYKQALAEREEKLQKKKEQSEMKRLLAKKKASELLKEKEEREEKEFKNMTEMTKVATQHKMQKLKLQQQQKHQVQQQQKHQVQQQQKHQVQQQMYDLPQYMVTKAPLLPTEDCYDSDHPEYTNEKSTTLEWATSKNLKKRLDVMHVIGESMKNTLFSVQTHTPNLQEIFEYIDPKKLKRTSSAIWKKPPRYTLFSVTRDIVFSDDED